MTNNKIREKDTILITENCQTSVSLKSQFFVKFGTLKVFNSTSTLLSKLKKEKNVD